MMPYLPVKRVLAGGAVFLALALPTGIAFPFVHAQERATENALPATREAEALFDEGTAFAEMESWQAALADYELIEQKFGTTGDAETLQWVARALVGKGIALEAMGMPGPALAAYDEVVNRFGEATSPAIREQVANALMNQGAFWLEHAEHEKAAAAFEAIDRRFGQDAAPVIREIVARALSDQGIAIYNQDRRGETIALYDRLEARFENETNPAIRIHRARARFNKGVILENMENFDAAFDAYSELERLFGKDDNPDMRKWIAFAGARKGEVRGLQGRHAEAIVLYDQVAQRFGQDDNPGVRSAVAAALTGKGVTLNERLHDPAGALETSERVLRQYCANVEDRPGDTCDRALGNTVEPLILLGRTPEALARIRTIREQSPAGSLRIAVMTFLAWLIESGEYAQADVVADIRAIAPDASVSWLFNSMRPLMERQPEPRKTQARCFAEFFEDHRNADILESCLDPADGNGSS
ncbi:MAG: hypothetical protein LBO79_09005 [Zoogloeaceae bacterium]|jgi:tetratricopeptide (TPR) repeat protein|nr:hypothetical protein [Zoogloeaceae bacterium]